MTVVGNPDWLDPDTPQGGQDLLLSTLFGGGTNSFSFLCSQNLGVYERLEISVGLTTANLVQITATSSSFGVEPPQVQLQCVAGGIIQAFIPYGGPVGDEVTVNLVTTNNIAGTNGNISVWGVRKYPPDLRWDGVLPGLGKQATLLGWATGTTTILGALGQDASYVIKAIIPPIAEPQAATVAWRLEGVVGGVSAPLATALVYTGGYVAVPFETDAGILVDPNSAVVVNASATPTTAFSGSILYDVVQI